MSSGVDHGTSVVTRSRTAVVHAGEDTYDQLRDTIVPGQRPAAVVRATSAEDIRSAVIAARELDRPLAVRSTGHGSHAPADGAVLLSTAGMTRVAIDPGRRTVRVQPGVRWSQVIAAAAVSGLAPTSGDHPGVGVVGFTLGGGVGWLSRRYGYAADNLVAADLVTADGRRVRASADDHPDLFWALRGGGGNFGAVTAMEIGLVPVAEVAVGTLAVDIARAPEVLTWFAEHADRVPHELSIAPVLRASSPVPGHTGPVLMLYAVHCGTREQAERDQRWLARSIGPVVAAGWQPVPYTDLAIPGTPPRGFAMYESLPDQVITDAVDAVVTGEAAGLEFRHWGGAPADPGPGAGPVGHRQLPYSIKINAGPATVERLSAVASGKTFLNFLADTTRTRSAYRMADYYRLREVKRRYDPEHVFRVGHAIPPA